MAVLKMVKDSCFGISYVKVLEVKDQYIELDNSNYNNALKAFEIVKNYAIKKDINSEEFETILSFESKFDTGYPDGNGNYRINKDFAREISNFLYVYFSSKEFISIYREKDYKGYKEAYYFVSNLKDVCSDI